MEDTNQSLTKAEYEAMVAGKDADDAKDDDGYAAEDVDAAADIPKRDMIAEVGKFTKKRKAAKIIGEETADQQDESMPEVKKAAKKVKKKGKPVKLSFGDEE